MQLPEAPRTVGIAVTGRCNLSCGYCFYANEMNLLPDLPDRDWLSFIDQLGSMGVMRVLFTGGEPLLRPGFVDLVDRAVENRLRYSILSNGTLLTEEMAGRLAEGRRRTRMDYLQISIDGHCAEVHERSRPGGFEAAVAGLERARAAGLPVAVRATIGRHNVDHLGDLARFLLEDLGLDSFGTNEAFGMGSGCGPSGGVLTPEESWRAMDDFRELMARYPGRIQAQAGPAARTGFFDSIAASSRTGAPPSGYRGGFLSGCGCVWSRIDVMHDGSIVPCHILHGMVMGNVTTDGLAGVWLDHPVMKALRARADIPMEEVPGCGGCAYSAWCTGSCPGLALEMTGDMNAVVPVDCYRRFAVSRGVSDAV